MTSEARKLLEIVRRQKIDVQAEMDRLERLEAALVEWRAPKVAATVTPKRKTRRAK